MYKPKLSDPEENRQENRAHPIYRKVEEYAQWSHVAQSMMYKHHMGKPWCGRDISAFKAFDEAIQKRRKEMAEKAEEENKTDG